MSTLSYTAALDATELALDAAPKLEIRTRLSGDAVVRVESTGTPTRLIPLWVFILDNEDGMTPDERDEMRAELGAGRSYRLGGGAAPLFTVSPV